MSDYISLKEMDRLVNLVNEQERKAQSNAKNNHSSYVLRRFKELYESQDFPLSYIENNTVSRLFPVGKHRNKPNGYAIIAGPKEQGILVWLKNLETQEIAQYHIQTNGLNGVKVTSKCS